MEKKFTVVIPAAGKGTRFAPFTDVVPKELVPIMQYPAIEFIAREYEHAAVSDALYVIAKKKEAIVEYSAKYHGALVKNHTVYQDKPLGLGHAVSHAATYVQENFFCIMLPDDIFFAKIPVLQQLKVVSDQYQASVIAIRQVSDDLVSSYGIVSLNEQKSHNVFSIDYIREKPKKQEAPSNYAIVGRYVLHRDIFSCLQEIQPGAGGEYQLTDAIQLLLSKGYPILAVLFEGEHFDIGTPSGWLKAVNYYAHHEK